MRLRDIFRHISSGEDRHLIRQFNLAPRTSESPPKIVRLLIDLGFGFELRELPYDEDGFLEFDSSARKGYRVVINSRHSRKRQRWTVAHEIAHYYLHRKDADFLAPVAYRAGGIHWYSADEEKEEIEANEFAETLFFGDGALEAARGMFGGKLDLVAEHFDLSEAAVGKSLRKLK